MKIFVISIKDKAIDFANTTVICGLYSQLREMPNFC